MFELLLAAQTLAALTAQSPSPASLWECRASEAIDPSLPVLRTLDDRERGIRERKYEPSSVRLFGLAATHLTYNRQSDDEFGVETIYYSSVVDGDINLVRWLVERQNPDLRCLPNGKSFTCLVHREIGKKDTEGYFVRTVSLAFVDQVNDDDLPDKGVLVSCSWDQPQTKRKG